MRIAIVGSGVAGLGAAWLISSRHEIALYEAGGHIGGHSNTLEVESPGGTLAVDTGFIVYNERNYPNLAALFRTLGVATQPSDMSFAVSVADGRLEYSGDNLATLYGQRRNLFKPSFHRMVADIVRFYREAPRLLENGTDALTLGEYLRANNYSSGFVTHHLLPMAAAIWSCSTAQMTAFPAKSFIRFFANHGLLSLIERPRWRTVRGGSREYVKRLTAGFSDAIRLDSEVVALRRHARGVVVRQASGAEDHFDEVIVATHADQALGLLVAPSERERRILGAFPYQANRAILHRDPRLMPKRRRLWGSWNYMTDGGDGASEPSVSVTYWMNRLQSLDPASPLFVSLNPLRAPDPALVERAITYHHPVFDAAALAAQRALATIQGIDRIWFCGSYFGHGFHEDALTSGLDVGTRFGPRPPWLKQGEHARAARPLGHPLPSVEPWPQPVGQ